MQGERSAIGSLPDTLGFDHGSTSSDAGLNQQLFWSNMRNSAHNMLPDCMSSAIEPNSAYISPIVQQGQNLSGWSVGEPSSSGTQNQSTSHSELKAEHGWSSSMDLEQRQYGPSNALSLSNTPLFLQNSSSDIPRDLNVSAGFVGQGSDDCQIVECPNPCKSSASSSSDPFGLPSGSGGYLVEDSNVRPGCSLDGRRASCKRKALEGNSGQSSSASGSSSYFQQMGSGSAWHALPGSYNAGSSLCISTPSENVLGFGSSEQMSSRSGLSARRTASESPVAINMAAAHAESSQRNYRVRISPPHQQDPPPTNVISTGSRIGHSSASSQQQSLRLLPLSNSLDMRSSSVADNTSSHRQPLVVRVPALRRTPHSSRWNGGSSSRSGQSSSSGGREAVPHTEPNSSTVPRNVSEPIFLPANDLRNSAQNSTNWSLAGGNISIAGNVASTSRAVSNPRVQQVPGPNWVPHRNTPVYPRRLSEYVRRSLLASAGPESGGQASSSSSVRGGTSQEIELSSGSANPSPPLAHSRPAILLERQLDGAFGIPYSLRTLAAASEGRSRLVSEIRSVLDLMRRGEGLRFEDVMILDQSVIFGMADIHDRHRDMRLDVDNMSYEELLALEERIGNVSTGLSEETIMKQMKQRKYFSIAMGSQLEVEPCCVCQEEYNDGEDIGTLECGHEFHTNCIKQWLMLKNLCPICKTTALSK
ncbi:hypothetical protein NMG60_11024250 [Bertholletia excelsa]